MGQYINTLEMSANGVDIVPTVATYQPLADGLWLGLSSQRAANKGHPFGYYAQYQKDIGLNGHYGRVLTSRVLACVDGLARYGMLNPQGPWSITLGAPWGHMVPNSFQAAGIPEMMPEDNPWEQSLTHLYIELEYMAATFGWAVPSIGFQWGDMTTSIVGRPPNHKIYGIEDDPTNHFQPLDWNTDLPGRLTAFNRYGTQFDHCYLDWLSRLYNRGNPERAIELVTALTNAFPSTQFIGESTVNDQEIRTRCPMWQNCKPSTVDSYPSRPSIETVPPLHERSVCIGYNQVFCLHRTEKDAWTKGELQRWQNYAAYEPGVTLVYHDMTLLDAGVADF